MRTLIFAVAILLFVPSLRAQQSETKENPPQAAPQDTTQNPGTQNSLPAELKPGHPLDPADVDILTGKRDRELELSRRANSLMLGGYGAYGSVYPLTGRSGAGLDFQLLPLRRFSSPFFFLSLQGPRGFGRRGVR